MEGPPTARLFCLVLALATSFAAWPADAPPPTDAQTPQTAPQAAEEPVLDPLASLRALGGYLTPDDMNQLTLYLGALLLDLLRGTQEATLPPDVAFKLAVLEQRFKKEGDAYLQQALRNLDRDLKRFLREGLPGLPAKPAATDGN